MDTPVRLFQIYYDAATRAALAPGFEPLDNTANARPDWYEYGPILRALDGIDLAGPGYCGFFSPKFARKTGLDARTVRDFVRDAPRADVYTFSTFPEHGAYFLNVFEQGDLFHPGLLAAARRTADLLWRGPEVDALVHHSRNTVFANFFVAGTAFWRTWRASIERGIAAAEDAAHPLHALLNTPTSHHGTDVPRMKVFLLERVAPALLAADPDWQVVPFQPLRMAVSHPAFEARRDEIAALDALKIAYAATRDPAFIEAFRARQAQALADAGHPWRDAWAARTAAGR